MCWLGHVTFDLTMCGFFVCVCVCAYTRGQASVSKKYCMANLMHNAESILLEQF